MSRVVLGRVSWRRHHRCHCGQDGLLFVLEVPSVTEDETGKWRKEIIKVVIGIGVKRIRVWLASSESNPSHWLDSTRLGFFFWPRVPNRVPIRVKFEFESRFRVKLGFDSDLTRIRLGFEQFLARIWVEFESSSSRVDSILGFDSDSTGFDQFLSQIRPIGPFFF